MGTGTPLAVQVDDRLNFGRLQQEYAAEDVQREVLALRQLYPYQQWHGFIQQRDGHDTRCSHSSCNFGLPPPRQKGILALEMEGEKRRMEAVSLALGALRTLHVSELLWSGKEEGSVDEDGLSRRAELLIQSRREVSVLS